jgi:hypothetical protein
MFFFFAFSFSSWLLDSSEFFFPEFERERGSNPFSPTFFLLLFQTTTSIDFSFFHRLRPTRFRRRIISIQTQMQAQRLALAQVR